MDIESKGCRSTLHTKPRNSSIDIFKYICAIMVIAIHTHPFEDVSFYLGYLFTQMMPRIGVPFFFAISGYFYIQKLEKQGEYAYCGGGGKSCFAVYVSRLLASYGIWSGIYFCIGFFQYGRYDIASYVISCVKSFATSGISYHFWFFPALIYSVCIVTLLFRFRLEKIMIPVSVLLYMVGCGGCSYYQIGRLLPVLGKLYASASFTFIRRVFLMGLPFFVSGYVAYRVKTHYKEKLQGRVEIRLLLGSIAFWLIEIVLVRILELQANIIITLGLYPMVVFTILYLLSDPFAKMSRLGKPCKVIANFTYYAHPIFMNSIIGASRKVFDVSVVSPTVLFVFTTLFSGIVGYMIYKWDNKVLNEIVK